MCRDNSLYSAANRVSIRYDLHDEDFDDKEYYSPRWHILAGFHSQHVIAYDSVAKRNVAFLAHWGIIPYYAKDLAQAKKDSFKFVNARAETIFEKPLYKKLIEERRCIVPSNGFFEHYESPVNKTKIPFHVRIKDEEIFSILGIYTYADFPVPGSDKKQRVRSFAMITEDANEFMAEIHNAGENQHRMPLMIPKDIEAEYINPHTSIDRIKEIIKFSIEAQQLEAWPVNSIRKKGKAEDESIILKADPGGIEFDYEHFNYR